MTFNCSTTCVGIYAHIKWIGNNIEEGMEDKESQDADDEDETLCSQNLLKKFAVLEKEVKLLKSDVGKDREELEKERFKLLLAEYRKFKAKNVRHYGLNPTASNFSKFVFLLMISMIR